MTGYRFCTVPNTKPKMIGVNTLLLFIINATIVFFVSSDSSASINEQRQIGSAYVDALHVPGILQAVPIWPSPKRISYVYSR